MEQFFTIEKAGIKVQLCYPDAREGYYRGTRFDRAGVFRSIVKDGINYADKWYDNDEPLRHDNVCACSEEFVLAVSEQACDFVKPGVGLLHKDAGAYDRFKLYGLVDEGQRSLDISASQAIFRQILGTQYEYEKTVRIEQNGQLIIEHCLRNLSDKAIDCYCYNHNFWTLSAQNVGAQLRIDFAHQPSGTWRDILPQVQIEDRSIVFNGPMLKGGKAAFIGDLSSCEGFEFTIRNLALGIGVRMQADHPISHSVFWSNNRVACVEPYAPLLVPPGEERRWAIKYELL